MTTIDVHPTSPCRTCGAPVVFGVTGTGAVVAVDSTPHPDGTVRLDESGVNGGPEHEKVRAVRIPVEYRAWQTLHVLHVEASATSWPTEPTGSSKVCLRAALDPTFPTGST